MLHWVRRIHILAGLQTSVALVLFACVTVAATVHRVPDDAAPVPEFQSRTVPIVLPADLSDAEVGRHIHALLSLPLTRPPRYFDRDGEGRLRFGLYPPNAVYLVTYDALRREAIVDTHTNGFGEYLVYMHTMGLKWPRDGWDLRIVLWSLYVEASALSLLGLALSGLYMWAAGRGRDRRAGLLTVTALSIIAAAYMAVQ